MKPSSLATAVTALLLAGASVASATTYVPVSDPNLADQAAAVARVKVISADAGPASLAPATDYLVEVDELVKGYLPGSTVVVRVPGGVRADGFGLKVFGAPEFQPGEEAVLFLQPAADGTYGILHLMLGAFHAQRVGNEQIAVQDLSEAHRLGTTGGSEEKAVRDLDRFTSWLADRAAGVKRPADYWMERPAAGRGSLDKEYATLPTADKVPVRWFTFDSLKGVSWKVHSSGQPGMELDQTIAAFQAALDAWTSDPTSGIQYVYGGTTTASNGLGKADGVNAILFNDPNGQVPGTFDCKTGGVVAMGGPYYMASTKSYDGQSYHEAFEGDVVTNDGTECFLKDPATAAEVFAHELGHTLGFGHATDEQALMSPKVHRDGRGAKLADDDCMGASVFYGDGSYEPAPSKPVDPAQSIDLKTGKPAKTEITLAWSSTFARTAYFQVESKSKTGYRPVLTVPASSTEATVKGLKANTAYMLRVSALDETGATLGSSNEVAVKTRK